MKKNIIRRIAVFNSSYNNNPIILVILIITVLSFINILGNKFVWDDYSFIIDWKTIRSINLKVFTSGEIPLGHEGTWRPLRTLIYSLDYRLWGINPYYYHLQSLVIHLFCTYLVYVLALKITRNFSAASFAMLMFGIHPAHTESIAFISASFDHFGSVFFLISVILFYTFLERGSGKYLVISYICTVVAFLFSEYTLTLPFLILVSYFLFKNSSQKQIPLWNQLFYFILLFCYFLIRFFIPHTSDRILGITSQISLAKIFIIWLHVPNTILTYFKYLLFPYKLPINVNITRYNPLFSDLVNISKIITDTGTWTEIILVAFSLFFIMYFRKRSKLAMFSLVWIYITLLPFLNIIPTNLGISVRYLYIPSVGYCLLFGLLIQKLNKKDDKINFYRYALRLFIIVICILMVINTVNKNFQWKNSFTLWSKNVSDAPSSYLSYANLGKAHIDNKEYDQALAAFTKALQLYPEHNAIEDYIGQTYILKGNYAKAITTYETVISRKPNVYFFNHLAIAYLKNGEKTKAQKILQENLKWGNNEEIYNTLGVIYVSKDMVDEAIAAFQKSNQSDPFFIEAYINLARLELSLGNIDKAIVTINKAVSINPEEAKLYQYLGKLYLQKGEIKKSDEASEKARLLFDYSDGINSMRGLFLDLSQLL